jgi:hypothetical protein
VVQVFTLEEQIERYLPDFKPWDLMVANVGAEFSEARIYQRNLLNFLKLYDDKKDVLPVLLWRETPAQVRALFGAAAMMTHISDLFTSFGYYKI